MSDDIDVQIASIVSGRTQQGMVELVVGGERMLIDLDKAREIRAMLDGAIEAAVSDELLVRFLTTKVRLSLDAATQALLDFREMRQGSKGVVYPT